MKRTLLHGIMAEFGNPTDLVVAIHKARAAGYRTMDAYSPPGCCARLVETGVVARVESKCHLANYSFRTPERV